MHPFLVTCVLNLILSVCKGRHANSCNVVPKDQYIEVGSDTEIVCLTSCVRGKVFWTVNNRLTNLSDRINSSHTVLSLRNLTQHSTTVQCHSADTQQVLGGTIIRTYSKPSKISCIWHYKYPAVTGVPQLLTCNWEHQNNSSLLTNYTVYVSSATCNTHMTECTFKDTDESGLIQLMYTFNVTVRAKTDAWEASSDPYEFDPFNIIKINPPDFSITVSSDHLLIAWKWSHGEQGHCQVKYRKAVLNKTVSYNENVQVFAYSVESCTNYQVSVRCALDTGLWSDWSQEKTVMTELNKSDVKLRLWRKIAKPDQIRVRKVHVLWMGIPSTCQGTFIYTIKQIPYGENTTAVNNTAALCSNSTCFVDVNQDAHRIQLTVYYNGASLTEASVYVPATGESLPQVTEIQTSSLEGVILVSWKAPVQPVRGYVIDWTHNGNQYHWQESQYSNTTLFSVAPNGSTVEKMPCHAFSREILSFNDGKFLKTCRTSDQHFYYLIDKKLYSITVTPILDDKTGHSSEALQFCSSVQDPDNITSVSVQPKDKSAHVRWSAKSQEECSGAVINYTIFYSTREGPMLNVTVDGSKRDIFLKDLNPDTEYSVYVKATASTGSTKSSESHFTTKRYDPQLITVISVSGSIVMILVLCFGLCCAIQWKKFKKIQLPNPALSSLALWNLPSHQKEMCSFQAFSNPSKSFCDRVYTEECLITPTPPQATRRDGNPASDQTEKSTEPAIVLAPDAHSSKHAELVETQHLCPAGESTVLLSSENMYNPYRSQSSQEAPAPRTRKPCKHVVGEQHEKEAPVTVYVTLNMFEQGHG